MAKLFKKTETGGEEKVRGLGISEGFRFGFGFFLAFLLGWVILVALALIVSTLARLAGFSL